MKRYSVSILYHRNHFNYVARTDNPDENIEKFKKLVDEWRERVKEENPFTDDFIGMRITDSKTKKVTFEETHYSEELGYKKIYEPFYYANGSCINKSRWVKLEA